MAAQFQFQYNMASTSILSLFVVVIVLVAASQGEEKYTNRWDNVDVEPILRNERLLKTYFRCLMDQGKCSPDAQELKKRIPDALENNCTKCTEKQKEAVEKVMQHMYYKRQDLFKQLEAKYDPSGKYRAKYSKEAEKKGYVV